MEISGSKLLNGGVNEAKKLLGDIYQRKGGVLFIDEAYQLDPARERNGAQILDYVLSEVENNRDRLVIVLAGYKSKMDKLFEHNAGLPSRFPVRIHFPDYSR